MAGWSHEKRVTVEKQFYRFLNCAFVNSKDATQPIILGEHLLEGQRRFITAVFDGLEQDKHKIYVLKSRQLGISTIARALSIFYLGLHRGMLGALVFDTAENKNNARAELETMINDLPEALRFPGIRGGSGNREGLTLLNDARILFKSAGVKKTKTSGTLGRSVGISFHHCSELCSWDNEPGFKAYEQSLSERNPDRLYIYESTARGPNMWKDLWEQAKENPQHCITLFIGWWSHDYQCIGRDDADFAKYGVDPPNDLESYKIKKVKELYDWEITTEQLAWIRRKMDPAAAMREEGYNEDDPELIQEQAWHEQEAFQVTGSIFFPGEVLTNQANKYVNQKFDRYCFIGAEEFTGMRVYKAENSYSTELKVWEEPDSDANYVIGVDPAYGENEQNDRSSIQVLRCYADGVDQVAEYAWPLATTRHLAWVMSALMGWYSMKGSEVKYILELNGPGMAVFSEIKMLRKVIDSGYKEKEIFEAGLRDVFRNVRTYIYSRPDAMGAGYNYHMKTFAPLKITFMERLRDFVSNGMLHIRSMACIREMTDIARDGDTIAAPGKKKDDRVLAMALAVHYWETNIRQPLMMQKKTREAVAAKRRASIVDQITLFQRNQLTEFFKVKAMQRSREQLQVSRQRWRYGR